jgi:hypothetical protein
MSELLTTADAARIAVRTPETIRRAADAGRIRVALRTVSGVRLFRRADVERFRRECELRTTAHTKPAA